VRSYVRGRHAEPAMVFDDTPVLCGHRGSGKGVVDGHGENALGSFLAAARAGLEWVEVDARLTADGVLVARHDPTTEDGRFVADLTAHETDSLGLMRIADLLEALPPEIGIDFDLKSSLEDALRPRDATTAARLADLATLEATRRRVLITTFDAGALLIVRERAPNVPLGLLTWNGFPLRKAIAAAAHLRAEVVGPHVNSFPLRAGERPLERETAHTVGVAHRAGLQVLAWSATPKEGDELLAAGVDGLVVDDVPRALDHYAARLAP
jgi:glycerophosphoryl diester phosphodiesterase